MKNQYEIDYQQGYDNADEKWLERMDKIRDDINGITPTYHNPDWSIEDLVPISKVLKILDKYKAESER